MDAMTHSSSNRDGGSGSGRPGDANARSRPEQESQDGWGWFTKVNSPQPEPESVEPAPQRPRPADGDYSAIRPSDGDPGYRRDSAYGRGGSYERGASYPREGASYPREGASYPRDDGYGSEPGYDREPEYDREPGYDRRPFGPQARREPEFDTPYEREYGPSYGRGGYDRRPGEPNPRYGAEDEREPEAPRWDAGRSDRWGGSAVPQPRSADGPRGDAGYGRDTSGRDTSAAGQPPAGGWFGSARAPGGAGPAETERRPEVSPPAGREGTAGGASSYPAQRPAPASTAVPAAPASREPAKAAVPAEEEPTGTAAFGPDEEASPDAILIRRTMKIIEPVADKTTSYFYALLFLQHPELRELFPAAMDTQRDRLFRALLTAAKHVDDAETLSAYLANLGRGHRKYGTVPDHYPAVGECLIGALTRYASEIWNGEVEAAWVRAYTAISQIMIDAAAENELTAPPWWHAEIVSHERRTAEIAVITVRPDQPYPFLAGQYTSLETPWWPRVWRHYSFASAPRADGLLSFHVKAVPAGWVSSSIVNRARAGDVIRLGPPAGSMTVDHDTDNGLLCLGGGTGIAPIKALVEDVAEHGRRRPVDVFYAARRDHDLYNLDTMLRLAQQHPWLSVRPVVSDTPVGGGPLEAGQLPEVVARYGPWPSYDAYLSGPPGMIRSSVDALVGIGMSTDRIRHDSLEELVSARD
jgi:NAD(P)H-flavin reductase/hemoglobin-like flavoprotein